jgi:hypothetical protein
MTLLYGLSIAFNIIVAGAIWFVKSQCEKQPFVKQKFNGFIQALFYDGEG